MRTSPPMKEKSKAKAGGDRLQNSVLSVAEKHTLQWLVARLPRWVNADHLTILALASMLAAGILYALSAEQPWLLHLVNVCLAVNWFGDSLDGTVARYRKQLRPNYGYYVDHICDSFGALFLVGGLVLSGYMNTLIGAAVLSSYFLLSINSYLAAHALGRFQISFLRFSPTELRILLAIGNLVLIYKPLVTIFGSQFPLMDVGGAVGAVVMLAVAVGSIARNTQQLYVLERL